jgi:GNAT superfamily N-acetyltransferase
MIVILEQPTPTFRFSLKIDGKEVGRARLVFIENDLHARPYALLEDVWVNEEMRGAGCGKKILKRVFEFAQEKGCYKLIANSRDSNERVHGLYERLGFHKHGIEFRMDFP